jgi:hypothetical protein
VDGDGIGERDLVKLPEVIDDLTLVEPHGDLALDRVDLDNLADVPVEHVFVVVVLRLDYLIPQSELPAELLHDLLLRPGRVQLALELHVQLADAQGATVHRAEHLDVSDRVEAELGR